MPLSSRAFLRRLATCASLLAFLAIPAPPSAAQSAAPAPSASARATAFPTDAHPDAPIEWWYANAHVTTRSKRHLAIVAAFFEFAAPALPLSPKTDALCHYVIYGVTDLDTKQHRFISAADQDTLEALKPLAPMLAGLRPNDPGAKALADAVAAGTLPAPHRLLDSPVTVQSDPFRLAYGPHDSLAAVAAGSASYDLALGDGPDKIALRLTAQRPPMAVGGAGETGVVTPSDMHYFSLTRCAVTGTVDTGDGPEPLVTGQGWIDHQWGSSWTTDKAGWDWFGVQLADGADILVYRLRNLATGKTGPMMATVMDPSGRQHVTRKVLFEPDPRSIWKSPGSGVGYPLVWSLKLPDDRLQLRVTAAVPDQEIPVVPPSRPIWEGTCVVTGSRTTLWRELSPSERAKLVRSLGKKGADADAYAKKAFQVNMPVARFVSGLAFMELVGYNGSTTPGTPPASSPPSGSRSHS